MRVSFVMILLFPVLGLLSCTAQNESANNTDPNVQDSASLVQQGMKIYLDPLTGKPSMPPAGPIAPAGAGLNTSSQGLVEQPLPGGGVKVDLKGRFQSSTTASVKEDGSVVVEHLPAAKTRALPNGE